jgi:hypothetical protein
VKALPILALLSLATCARHASPDDTFRAFTLAVLSHQPDIAWGMLSKDSQEAMTAATHAAAAAAPKGEVPDDPKAFLFGEDVGLARPIQEIKVIDEGNGVAHLSVTTSSGKHTVTMLLEGGRWKLDLTEGVKL